jgi:hypothetical protein
MRDKYNYLDQFMKDLTKEHLRCLTSYDQWGRKTALDADMDEMHEVMDMQLINDDGTLTAIGDLIVLEVENRLPK